MAADDLKLNFLLLGKTGHGKSATGNSILNRNAFKVSSRCSSETKEVACSFSQYGDRVLMVVDGPGLEDTDANNVDDIQKALCNMTQALALCYDGIDAFLFVVRFANRFTREDKAAIVALKRIFGDKYLDNVIVVMTGGDLFENAMEEEECNFTFDEWCRTQRGELRQLYTDCSGRFVLFNNREKDEDKKKAQIQKIVQLAETLKKSVGRYNSECFQRAKYEREKLILESKAPQLTLQIQEKISLLTADLEVFSKKPTDDGKIKIIKWIQELKAEIAIQDRGYGVLDDMRKLVDKVESSLDNTMELQRLATQLEITRMTKTVMSALGSVCGFAAGALALIALHVADVGIAIDKLIIGSSKTNIKEKQTEIKRKFNN